MWLRVLTAVSLTTQVLAQHSYLNQRLQHNGAGFEWGWHLPPLESTLQLDQYYVQVPNHLFPPNNTNLQHKNSPQSNNIQTPVSFYYLQNQYSSPELQSLQIIPEYKQYTNQIVTPRTENYPTQTEPPQNTVHTTDSINYETTKATPVEEKEPIVQVFKDHNCTEDVNTAREYNNNMRKEEELSVELPSYDDTLVFGARQHPKQSTEVKIDRTRGNTKNEGYYYYSTEDTNIDQKDKQEQNDQDSISRLVASTQDLISNEDLVRINYSAEKHAEINDDYIKPRQIDFRTDQINQNSRHITVRAKISNIENQQVVSEEAKDDPESYRFSSPIVVQDPQEEIEEQVIDTLVSTMAPYLDNGYEIVSVKQLNHSKTYVPQNFDGETIHVTPRPVGQKYLAPITVALRLLNSNNTETFNSIEDPETSDTEFIEETVRSPPKERTVVEIQKSIPLDITHINEVEVHEYMEMGRSNPYDLDAARNLYNRYMESIEAEKQKEENQPKNNGEVQNTNESNKEVNDDQNGEDQLEPSENMQSDITVSTSDYNKNHKTENSYEKRNVDNDKMIQPIIIEKEIRVPHYVDRFIEKQVPYPEPVEVVKHVTVDRPYPVPVPYEVEKPVEVTKYIDKPYPVEVPQYIKVPYPVHQKVYIDRPVHIPYPVEKIVEKEVVRTVPVPTPVAVPVKVQVPVEKPVLYPVQIEKHIPVPIEKPVPVERVVHKEVPVPYPVEKKVLYPVPYEKTVHVPYPVEKKVAVPVEKIVERPVAVPVPIHIMKPYPVDRIVERKVPYPVDRIVEKEVQVRVPYPVEKVVEKVVEKPVVVTKYIDKPYPVETKVPYIIEKIVNRNIPYAIHPYNYDGTKQGSEYHPRYLTYQNKIGNHLFHQSGPTYKVIKGYSNNPNSIPIKTTRWGNAYASTYTYNGTDSNGDANQEYVTRNGNYYGPPPMSSYTYDNGYVENDDRTHRAPKMSNLRIEYGFKPPLIPSTEVDLDGRPIEKILRVRLI